jgi:UDP-glucose 4-epimerase
VSDGADLTIGALVKSIATAMNKKVLLVPVPVGLMQGAAKALGKGAVADRVFGSLQVDISHTRERVEWTPIVSTQAAIDKTVAHFLASKGKK